MFKFKNIVFSFTTLLLFAQCSKPDDVAISQLIDSNIAFCEQQLSWSLNSLKQSPINPRTVENDTLKLVKSSDWTSGFFPGCLWYMLEFSNQPSWKTAADHYSMNIEAEKLNGHTHDMGFKLYCSFGNGYRLTHNNEYQEILLQGAETLSKRFNPVIGCIRSWDHNSDKWDYPVIIDNMLNLELLFWATKAGGDSTYYKIAVSHAEKTMQNHFRSDYSSYHVVSYDTITGEPLKKNTHQGYADESAWARGQAWGLYGYTMVYRETGDVKFLNQAKQIAHYILSSPNLPDDGVTYWDFNAPNIPDEPRDASAAAVICSALYELGTYVEGEEQHEYFEAADRILRSLSSTAYRANVGENHGFLLKHSVGSYPHDSEINVPIIYADYYFMEANLRRQKILKGK